MYAKSIKSCVSLLLIDLGFCFFIMFWGYSWVSATFYFLVTWLFPLSITCVEHLFSMMKLIKTRLRKQLGETTLDSLLQISTEYPTGFDNDEYEYFVDELKRLNPQMRTKL